MNKFDDYVYFVLVKNSNASYGFTGYQDLVSGQIKTINFGKKDHRGVAIPHKFRFDKAHRTIRVHKNQIDMDGNNIADFLRDFPECEGSRNGYYMDGVQSNMWFKEINEGKDASLAVEAKMIKLKAENTAAGLEGVDLQQMAVLCGMFDSDPTMQMHRVLEYSGADPSKFLDLYNGPERAAKSLLSRAVREGMIVRRGAIFAWKNVTIGANEELAVSKLMADSVLAAAIETNLQPTGFKTGSASEVIPEKEELPKSEVTTVPEYTPEKEETEAKPKKKTETHKIYNDDIDMNGRPGLPDVDAEVVSKDKETVKNKK